MTFLAMIGLGGSELALILLAMLALFTVLAAAVAFTVIMLSKAGKNSGQAGAQAKL